MAVRSADVVVVGGRVAGASTAMLLARRGHEVLLIDRVDPATDTFSSHAMMRTGVLQLTRWGVLDRLIEAGTPPIRQITLGFADEIKTFDLRSEYGVDALYAPRRFLLDRIMAEEARRSGATVRIGLRAVDVSRDHAGRVDGVVVTERGRTRTLKARFVVGADGVYSRMASLVGARTLRSHDPQNSLIYGYYRGIEASGYEFHFTPGYNVGLIPTNEGLVNVFTSFARRPFDASTEVTFARALKTASPRMASRVFSSTRVGNFRRSSGIPGFVRQPYGPGWALVGDAGFTKDPISAHGISDALRDAELAANAIHEALEDPPAEAAVLGEYQAVRDRFAIPLFEESRILSAYGWDAPEASERLRNLSAITDSECTYLSSLDTPLSVESASTRSLL